MCKIGGSISNIEMYKKLDSKENVGIKKQTNEINTKDSTNSNITKMPNDKDSKQVGSYKKDQGSELTDSIKSKFDKMFSGGLKELSKSKDGIKGELKSNDKNGEIKQHEGGLKEDLKSHDKEGKINSHEGGLKENIKNHGKEGKINSKDSLKELSKSKDGIKGELKEGFSKLEKNDSMKEQIKEKLKDLKMTPDIHAEKHTLEMTPEKAGKLKELIQKIKTED